MKRYERELLNNLTGLPEHDSDMLYNVRHEMGDLSYLKGNPLTKTEIAISVRQFYCDVAVGALIAPAALPAALQQQRAPVYLFGLTDMLGGYVRSLSLINNPAGLWQGYNTVATSPLGIYNYNIFYADIAVFSIPMANQCTEGDMIFLRFAIVGGITYINLMIIHCNSVAYGTFLHSFVSDLITIDTIRYIVPAANINQLINPIIFAYQTLFGKLASDNVNPRNYISNTDFQQQICDLPVNIPIDKALMFITQMDTLCERIDFILFVKKVQPLTNRPFNYKKYTK